MNMAHEKQSKGQARSTTGLRRSLFLIALFIPFLLVMVNSLNARAAGGAAQNPELVIGLEGCSKECHKVEADIWKNTKHGLSLNKLPDSKKAMEITEKMGIKSFKREERCVTCHFTRQQDGNKIKTISGPSCEDCHGQGKEWSSVHGDFGGKDVTKSQESAAHKQARISRSEAAGMIKPDDLFKMVQNCFNCHLGHDEELVNKGGHTAGSDIELVSWTQGKVGDGESIRHNVWHTKSNDIAPAPRRRMLFVLGTLLEMEYALRAVGRSTQKEDFAKTMARRAKKVSGKLTFINDTVAIPEIQATLSGLGQIKQQLKLNNATELNRLADLVAHQAKLLASNNDGSKWAALDAVMPFQP
ncbi:MAG: hypothetical protein HQL67_12200 [Magnetococcales bacterium]|nr:hypothetical protein [Magnetococcales bacterium]